MSYKYILFDLDGTVTDSSEGILRSLEYAFEQMGEPVPSRDILKKFIGPPLKVSFRDLMGYDDEKSDLAIAKYRERFSVKGLYENYPYEGIEEAMQAAIDSGKTLALATSKPEQFTLRIVEYFGLGKYFKAVAAAQSDNESKSDVIVRALQMLNLTDGDKPQVLMIGDRMHDIIGAHENGIKCLGVDYGFAPEGEFKEYGADYTVTDTAELKKFLSEI